MLDGAPGVTLRYRSRHEGPHAQAWDMSRCVARRLWYLTSGSACVISCITRAFAPRSSTALHDRIRVSNQL